MQLAELITEAVCRQIAQRGVKDQDHVNGPRVSHNGIRRKDRECPVTGKSLSRSLLHFHGIEKFRRRKVIR